MTLEVWHPGCWTIETTEATDVGILGRVVSRTTGARSKAFVTLYADRRRDLDDAVETIRTFPQVHTATEVPNSTPEAVVQGSKPGNATRDLLIEHEAGSQISGAFLSRDFVTAQPVNTHDGREQWNLLTMRTRRDVRDTLDTIATAHDAEITVSSLARTTNTAGEAPFSITSLSARQREVFELARARGYYEWPKQISGTELADELDIATATLHEHLHKAEAKLLGTP
ncbi:helix-turn-helix domain-containing protein [Natronococcus pandeyae]|uniref:helix-turn-helix domain-containing protein n=1 Tax=Natronococcus pandeyae TaxID=2055836 RepID=UPI001652CF17|nr:helix-turn-helix domain-containing protein [Natronococcus pandeyae]